MTNVLLVIWLATIGADRIDFFGGRGPFILTPFLVLSPVAILLFMVTLMVRRPSFTVRLPQNLAPYLGLATALVLTVLVSVLFSRDVGLGAKRFVLLAVEVYAVCAVAVSLYNRPNSGRIFYLGACAGILLSLFFDVAQLLNWLGNPLFRRLTQTGLVDLAPPSVGVFAPRLAGLSLDMNRGGVLLIVYSFLVLKFGRGSKWQSPMIYLAFILLVLTLSRSAVLAFALMGIVLVVQRKELRLSSLGKVIAVLCVLGLIGIYAFNRTQLAQRVNVAELLAERASFSTGESGGMHLAIAETGLDTAGSSWKNTLLGIGFGNSYLVLGQFFPGNKYANFHSLYLSFLVESGILSLVLLVLLQLLPLARSRDYLPLIIAMIGFNVFYQMTLEPVFWLSLLLCWTNIGFESSRC